MENLNAEQIKKALEWAIEKEFCSNCLCTAYGESIVEFYKEILALITSQEQRIKELAEENERLRTCTNLVPTLNEVAMSEKKIERIRVIVREHLDDDPFEKAIAEARGVKPKGSTVGVKLSVGGKFYGDYVGFKKSTLSASEVAESLNELFESTLKEMLESDDG